MTAGWAPQAPGRPPGPPRSFPRLLEGGLVGISDRTVKEHLRLYEKLCAELAAIRASYPTTSWTAPQGLPIAPSDVQALLETPVRALPLPTGDLGPGEPAADGKLGECLAQLRGELVAKGISWWPGFYLGDADFWTTDQATSINLPWFLATDQLWRLVNDQTYRYTPEELMMVLRHEAGHAIGYAFELWKTNGWDVTFGDFFQPYRDAFDPVPDVGQDFVQHLHRSGAAANVHYAQKHPDEDWAETFATWLDPGSRWAEVYPDGTRAREKLEMVETLIVGNGLARGPRPPNRATGRRTSFTSLDYTVGDFLGQRPAGQFSQHSALARREPAVYDGVVLHEAYFGQLARGAGGGILGADLGLTLGLQVVRQAAAAFGSWEAYLTDLRAICGSTDGWALTVWDPRDARVRNVLVEGHDRGVPADCSVLLAVDVHEHAFVADYPASRKDLYLAAFFKNVDWSEVERRLDVARLDLPEPPEVVYAGPNRVLRPFDRPPAALPERKRCGNCALFLGEEMACAIVMGRITENDVCAYHVNVAMDGGTAGLIVAPPGGTSCDCCAHYRPSGPDVGTCAAVQQGGAPAVVAARGCCGRWTQGLVNISPGPILIADAPVAIPVVTPAPGETVPPRPAAPVGGGVEPGEGGSVVGSVPAVDPGSDPLGPAKVT